MKYAKFVDGKLVQNPGILIKDRQLIIKPTPEQMAEAGYLPIEETEAPAGREGYIKRFRWVQTQSAIVKKWTVLPDNRPLSQNEVNRMVIAQQINTLTVDDNTALRMKRYYPTFESLAGQTVKQGFRFSHEDKLWSVIQPELTIQAHYPPGVGTESLYTEVVESHEGTLDDPIPYDGNMALENGRYYVQNNIIYLCSRDTGSPVYHALAELVGLYVEEM